MKRELLRIDHVTLVRSKEVYLNNLCLEVYSSEIVGLVARAEKGCDRLVEVLRKNIPISQGRVWLDGETVNEAGRSNGQNNRVYVIERQSHLIDSLSIADNLFVMRGGFKKYFINERVLAEQAKKHLKANQIDIDIKKRVSELSPLERCEAELAKALLSGARIIIIDNPSNFLSQHELVIFQGVLRRIISDKLAVLYIGYHHQEVFRIADRTALFNNGKIKKIFYRDEQEDRFIEPYIENYKRDDSRRYSGADEGIMHFHSVEGEHIRELDFVVHKGECLTLLDMDNKIYEDIYELLTGVSECKRGRITLDHESYSLEGAESCLDKGVAIVPLDAAESLVFYEESYIKNLTFLLDKKIKKSLISPAIYKSVYKEYRPLIGSAIDAPNMMGLDLKDIYSMIYYRIQLFHPKVVVCIQPFAKGDMYCRVHIAELIRRIQGLGIGVLIVTANISDTPLVANRLMVIEDGSCVTEYDEDEIRKIITENRKIDSL